MSQYIQFTEGSQGGGTLTIQLQDGPIGPSGGVNGCQIDDVIAWTRQRIETFNAKYPCRENSLTLTKLDEALLWLLKRRLDREARHVEGKNAA